MWWIVSFAGVWLVALTWLLWMWSRFAKHLIAEQRRACQTSHAVAWTEQQRYQQALQHDLETCTATLISHCVNRYRQTMADATLEHDHTTAQLEDQRQAVLEQLQHLARTILTAEDVCELATHVLAAHVAQKIIVLPDDQAPQVNVHELAHSNFLRR